MVELLEERGISDQLDDLCEEPFRQKWHYDRSKARVTRYSDGTFPVFYSSMEVKTAEAEIQHWFPTYSGRPHGLRKAYYTCFKCQFSGSAKDIRPKQTEWPGLTADDYRFCNKLGKEAIRLDLDALVVPSARRQNGNNIPVFKRTAISRPAWLKTVALTYDPSKKNVTVDRNND